MLMSTPHEPQKMKFLSSNTSRSLAFGIARIEVGLIAVPQSQAAHSPSVLWW
jgi:hypothetical protein